MGGTAREEQHLPPSGQLRQSTRPFPDSLGVYLTCAPAPVSRVRWKSLPHVCHGRQQKKTAGVLSDALRPVTPPGPLRPAQGDTDVRWIEPGTTQDLA